MCSKTDNVFPAWTYARRSVCMPTLFLIKRRTCRKKVLLLSRNESNLYTIWSSTTDILQLNVQTKPMVLYNRHSSTKCADKDMLTFDCIYKYLSIVCFNISISIRDTFQCLTLNSVMCLIGCTCKPRTNMLSESRGNPGTQYPHSVIQNQ